MRVVGPFVWCIVSMGIKRQGEIISPCLFVLTDELEADVAQRRPSNGKACYSGKATRHGQHLADIVPVVEI